MAGCDRKPVRTKVLWSKLWSCLSRGWETVSGRPKAWLVVALANKFCLSLLGYYLVITDGVPHTRSACDAEPDDAIDDAYIEIHLKHH